jgi:hypothetical protein
LTCRPGQATAIGAAERAASLFVIASCTELIYVTLLSYCGEATAALACAYA